MSFFKVDGIEKLAFKVFQYIESRLSEAGKEQKSPFKKVNENLKNSKDTVKKQNRSEGADESE